VVRVIHCSFHLRIPLSVLLHTSQASHITKYEEQERWARTSNDRETATLRNHSYIHNTPTPTKDKSDQPHLVPPSSNPCLSNDFPRDHLDILHSRLHSPLHLPRLDLCLRPLNLLRQKRHALIRAHAIRQMRGQHRQNTPTHRISRLTDNINLLLWEVGDLVVVLLLLRVAVEYHARDLRLHVLWEAFDGAVTNGGALGVAAGDDDAVGAFRCHVGERGGHEALGDGVCAAGEDIGAYEGGVGDAFGCDGVAAEVLLEAVRGRGANDGALGTLERLSLG
jgi:hypothetical protein